MSLRWDVFWVFALVHDLQECGGWVILRRFRLTVGTCEAALFF